MSKIKLYKNNSLVFEKDGNINDNIFEVENINKLNRKKFIY